MVLLHNSMYSALCRLKIDTDLHFYTLKADVREAGMTPDYTTQQLNMASCDG